MRDRRGRHIEIGARNARILRALLLCIGACLLFCAGFLARGNAELMERMGVIAPEDPSKSVSSATVETGEVASRLDEVERMLMGASLDVYDTEAATLAVLDAFLKTTDDAYARYFDPGRYAAFVDVSKDDYPGVGVFFAEENGRAYALDVFEGSSAAEAGVRRGDVVVAIDGDRSQDWTATEAINAVQREDGSSVVVTWLRPSTTEDVEGVEFTTTLICSDYKEPNVTTQKIESVGYIALKQFTQNSDALVRQAVEDLASEGATSFVLDLRDNPGGYLTKAVDVASLFIRSGVVVEIDTLDAKTTKQVSGDAATDAPLVVLVNGNTAGAAEVLAAALHDTGRATLAGTTTMGKGSVQVTKPLSFGGALRYTAARYVSPNGYLIDNAGVVPDVTVTMRDDASSDSQKDFAVETAASLAA
ncbi:MAG: S41 family peptidase [Slackia sp.]|nr:S41 family peptidase [Slackia sp.]